VLPVQGATIRASKLPTVIISSACFIEIIGALPHMHVTVSRRVSARPKRVSVSRVDSESIGVISLWTASSLSVFTDAACVQNEPHMA
jgi:hypothetical protein